MNLFPPTRSLGVFVEDDRFSRGVEVISEGEPTYSDGDLFALEDHRLVGVVRHPDLKVPAREAESGRPEGLQLGHVQNLWLTLRLCTVPQISRRHGPFIVAVAHDWPGFSRGVSQGSERTLHIGQIRTEKIKQKTKFKNSCSFET